MKGARYFLYIRFVYFLTASFFSFFFSEVTRAPLVPLQFSTFFHLSAHCVVFLCQAPCPHDVPFSVGRFFVYFRPFYKIEKYYCRTSLVLQYGDLFCYFLSVPIQFFSIPVLEDLGEPPLYFSNSVSHIRTNLNCFTRVKFVGQI